MIKSNNEKNKLVRKWIRENGAANFDFHNKNIILNDGLLFSIESKIKDIPALKVCGEEFDFKNKDIVLTDGILFNIEKEIQKLNKVKDTIPTFTRGIYQVQLTKRKYKTECYKCRIWFEELEELIAYFQSMKKLLNQLGYKTSHKKIDFSKNG
jgi:hypothetical protein